MEINKLRISQDVSAAVSRNKKATHKHSNISSNILKTRKLNKNRLICAKLYYQHELQINDTNKLWAKAICPFHTEHNPSLSINMVEGHYICHACGIKGGDIISFHMRRYGLNFKETVTLLGGWDE